MLAKRYLTQGKETEEQFSERVKECVHLFQEAQVCISHFSSGDSDHGEAKILEKFKLILNLYIEYPVFRNVRWCE